MRQAITPRDHENARVVYAQFSERGAESRAIRHIAPPDSPWSTCNSMTLTPSRAAQPRPQRDLPRVETRLRVVHDELRGRVRWSISGRRSAAGDVGRGRLLEQRGCA
ncbi:hypothetical protein [Sorangium sp. So ce1182]|uniref:hypothetical protein n=1 Tax=Sorangium sp. So ce1182 TaxID=3133334 RepID=UPI003F624091